MNNASSSRNYIYIDYTPAEDYFAVRARDDSLKNIGIYKGSVLVVRKQSDFADGDVAVVAVDGEIYARRCQRCGGAVFLMAENNVFPPMPILADMDFLVLGKVVEVRTLIE